MNLLTAMKKFAFLILGISLILVSCKKEKVTAEDTAHRIVVKDATGQVQANAEVVLFHSAADLLADTSAYLTLHTGTDGSVIVPENQVANTLICRAEKGTLTSEFLGFEYTHVNRTYAITIQQPSDDQLLCGHGSKKWIMTGYKINGTPQSYVVTSTLNADGTWTDTNGNSGNWHFTNNNTELVYDYTSSGMTVTFTVQELTADFISLKSIQSGMTIEMEMTAVD